MANRARVRARELMSNFDILMVLKSEQYDEIFSLADTQLPKGMKNVTINWNAWTIKPDGNISLVFPIHKYGGAKVLNYSPQQLPNLLHLLGAITSFYQSPMTVADAQEAYVAYENAGQKRSPEYQMAYNFAHGLGPAPRYINLLKDSLYFEGLQFAKPKIRANRRVAYPENLPQGEYNVLLTN